MELRDRPSVAAPASSRLRPSGRAAAIGVLPRLFALLAPALLLGAQEPPPVLAIARTLVHTAVFPNDDPDALAAELLAAAAQHGRSPAAALLVGNARLVADQLADPAAAIAAAERILAAEPNGIVALTARSLQRDLLRLLGRRDEAIAQQARLGEYDALVVVGPFGDAGDRYDRIAYAPEWRFPQAGERLRGRFGDVVPRLARRAPLGEWIHLMPRDDGRSGCWYGLLQIDAETAADGFVEVACPGSFELFVNGAPAGQVDRAALLGGTLLRWLPARFVAGRNHVLVKTTLAGHPLLTLRIVDAAGRPLAGIAAAADAMQVEPPAADAEPPPPAAFVGPLDALARAAAQLDGADATTVRLALMLESGRLQDTLGALAAWTALDAATPEPPEQKLALALALRRLPRIPAEIRRARARALIEQVQDRLPDHFQAKLARASYLVDDDRGEAAIRMLEADVAAGRAGPDTFRVLHEVQRGLSFTAQAERTLWRWREALPHDARPVLLLARRLADAGALARALELLDGALALRPGDTRLLETALRLARLAGDDARSARLHEALHGHEPDSIGSLRDQQADALHRGDRQAARRAGTRLAAAPRASARELTQQVHWLLRDGAEQDARELWQQAVAAGQSSHELHALFARLDARPAPEPVAALESEATRVRESFAAGPREQTAPSTLILDRMTVELLPDGAQIREVHQLRRINDPRGVEQHQEAADAARASEVLLLRTLLPDGRAYVPHRVEGSFSMPRLEPGALIEERYVERLPAPGADPLRATTFFFQSADEPFVHSELALIVPAGARGSLRARNFDGEPLQRDLGDGRTLHLFRRRDAPRLPQERLRPPDPELLPVVTWGEDGAGVARTREDLAQLRSLVVASAPIAAKALALTDGLTDDAAKLAAIHGFVHAEIPSGRGNPDPLGVLLLGRGPRLFLEAALLRAAGVPLDVGFCAPAHELLSDDPAPLFAGDPIWTVPCVRVRPNGAPPVWLAFDDPRHAPLGEIQPARLGASALLDQEAGPLATRLPGGDPAALQGVEMRGRANLGPNGDLQLEIDATLLGSSGLTAADQVRQREENVQKLIARQLAGQILRGWNQLEVAVTGIDSPGARLGLHARVDKGRALKTVGDRLLMPLPLVESRLLQSLGDRAERRLPYRLRSAYSDIAEIEVSPGDAFRITGVPEPTHVVHELIEYHLTFERRGEQAVVRRRVIVRPGDLPATRFGEWLSLLQQLDRAEAGAIEVRSR